MTREQALAAFAAAAAPGGDHPAFRVKLKYSSILYSVDEDVDLSDARIERLRAAGAFVEVTEEEGEFERHVTIFADAPVVDGLRLETVNVESDFWIHGNQSPLLLAVLHRQENPEPVEFAGLEVGRRVVASYYSRVVQYALDGPGVGTYLDSSGWTDGYGAVFTIVGTERGSYQMIEDYKGVAAQRIRDGQCIGDASIIDVNPRHVEHVLPEGWYGEGMPKVELAS